jgi:hypothetical protein
MRTSPHGVCVIAICSAGCGRVHFDPLGDGGPRSDGSTTDATVCTAFGPWGTPTRIAELSTAMAEYGGQILPDDLTLYFDRHGAGDEIFVARRPDRSSSFGIPQPLAELGTNAGEGSATLIPGELEIFFESGRSGTVCLYRATRASTAALWGTPAPVAALCGSPTEGAFVTRDGLTLYYNTATPPTDYEGTLMTSVRAAAGAAFPAGSPIAELAGGATQGYPALSADGLTLYFESGSPTDLYQATRPAIGMPFGAAAPVPGLNTSSIEQDVSISSDGLELFFASDRPPASNLDLYHTTRACM